jgi:hypothetical protein
MCAGASPIKDGDIDVQMEIPNIVINVLLAQYKVGEHLVLFYQQSMDVNFSIAAAQYPILYLY